MRGKPHAPPATPRKNAKSAHRRAPMLTRGEVRKAVVELASTLAPADIVDLLAEEATLRARASDLRGTPGEILRAQLDLALACLRDHAAGACPQIPYFSISLLGAGVAYLANQLDLIPDFLPCGTLDDALVMALACELASDGLRRYCTWKDVKPGLALAAASAPRARVARAR